MKDTAMIAAMSSPFAWIGKQALAALLVFVEIQMT